MDGWMMGWDGDGSSSREIRLTFIIYSGTDGFLLLWFIGALDELQTLIGYAQTTSKDMFYKNTCLYNYA